MKSSSYVRPNYFVGLKIPYNSHLNTAFNSIHQDLVSRNQAISRILSKYEKLHLTLALIYIEEDRINEAIQCFQNSADELRNIMKTKNNLSFPNINTFGKNNNKRVIWLEPEKNHNHDALIAYCNYISTVFQDASFYSTPTDILHMTIANKYNKKFIIQDSDYLGLDSYLTSVPPVTVNRIDLLKIGSIDPETNYYHSLSTLYINDTICIHPNAQLNGPISDADMGDDTSMDMNITITHS